MIGIRSRGVHLARRLARKIQEMAKISLPLAYSTSRPIGTTAVRSGLPAIERFRTAVKVDDKIVVLVDDVIFRGRTIRAAMEAVERMASPNEFWLLP